MNSQRSFPSTFTSVNSPDLRPVAATETPFFRTRTILDLRLAAVRRLTLVVVLRVLGAALVIGVFVDLVAFTYCAYT